MQPPEVSPRWQSTHLRDAAGVIAVGLLRMASSVFLALGPPGRSPRSLRPAAEVLDQRTGLEADGPEFRIEGVRPVDDRIDMGADLAIDRPGRGRTRCKSRRISSIQEVGHSSSPSWRIYESGNRTPQVNPLPHHRCSWPTAVEPMMERASFVAHRMGEAGWKRGAAEPALDRWRALKEEVPIGPLLRA